MIRIVLKFITGKLSYIYNVAVVKLDKAGCYGVGTSLGKRHFFLSMHIKTGPEPIQSLVHCVLGFFSGLKQLGLGFEHSPYLAPLIGG